MFFMRLLGGKPRLNVSGWSNLPSLTEMVTGVPELPHRVRIRPLSIAGHVSNSPVSTAG